MKKILSLFAALLFVVAANAKVTEISPTSPYETDAVRLALYYSAEGDTIVLTKGTYEESNSDYIAFKRNNVLMAKEGDKVIIKPHVSFRVRNGARAEMIGIRIDASEINKLSNYENIFEVHDATEGNCWVLKDCEIYGNVAKTVMRHASDKTLDSIIIDGCYIHDNVQATLRLQSATLKGVIIKNTTIANVANGGSFWCAPIDICKTAADAKVVVDHCTFYHNTTISTSYADVTVGYDGSATSDVTISNCIFAQPESYSAGRAINLVNGGVVKNCLTFNYAKSTDGIQGETTRTACITGDPLFVTPGEANYTLGEGSPALTAAEDGGAIGDPRWVPAAALEAPDAAPAAPEWPANQVKAVYSATYGADCGFGEWGSSTAYTQESFGKKYVTTNLGYFGMTFEDNALNCSAMEKLHLDIWIAASASVRVVPIWGASANIGVTLNLEGQKWNSFDIALSEFDGVPDWSNIYQIKIDEARELTFWVNNVFFYTTVAPAVDETAPADVTASATASYFSTTITAKATDASGTVIFTVKNGDEILALKSAASDADAVIPVKGLKPNTEYNLSVIAADESGNAAEPVVVATKTLVAPAAAPAPEFKADDVKSIFSDAYTAAPASIGTMIAGWWEPTELSEGELADGDHALFYAPKATGMFGWEFAELDATGFPYLHIDIYPLADGSIMIYPVDNIDPKQEYKETFDVKGNEWNHIIMDLTGKDLTKIYQIGWINYYALNGFFVDNVYFAKDEEPVVIEPADRRIIAWDLKSVLNGNDYKFTYKSNIDGYEANLIFLENGVEVGTKALDAPKAGVNEATIAKDELPAGKLNWAIELKAGEVETVKEFTDPSRGIYNFFLPQGIAVNNCTESDAFGHMYITEIDGVATGDNPGATDRTKYQKGGIFEYDLDLNELNPTNQGWLPGGIVAGSDRQEMKRIVVDQMDGMIYFNRTASILKVDPTDMTKATNILEGKEGITKVNSCYVENGVVYFMDNANTSTGGTLKKMDAEGNITSIIQSKLWGVQDNGICGDGRGGLWVAQHRWGPDAYSVLTHVTATGAIDYFVDQTASADLKDLFPTTYNASYRGQVAYNAKENLLAFAGNKRATLFKVTYDAGTGVPTLVRWNETALMGNNVDGVAFDFAGNLYTLSASSERMYAFSVPTEKNEVVVPAKSSLKVSSTATAIDETIAPVKAQKIFRGGQVLIIRDGKTYNMMGQIVR